MAENIEFIAAKDLPTTESKNVSVLCIDNGELKRSSDALFGGGYITVVDTFDTENNTGTINESYDNFIGILLAGGTVWVDLTSVWGETVYAMAVMWGFHEGTFDLICGDGMVLTCPNGTWTPEG